MKIKSLHFNKKNIINQIKFNKKENDRYKSRLT